MLIPVLRIIIQINFLMIMNRVLCMSSSSFDEDVWDNVPCDQKFYPEFCERNNTLHLLSVDDFGICGPARLPIRSRNYFLAAAGRRETHKENKRAFKKIKILPKLLRNLERNDMQTTVLGMEVDFPIGLSPVGVQKLADRKGELATTRGMAGFKTVMILSSYATTLLEDVAKVSQKSPLHLWMQIYLFKNRSLTVDIIRRSEKNGFKAIVLTADTNIQATLSCHGRANLVLPSGVNIPNIGPNIHNITAPHTSFKDITWLRSITRLPIVVKGLLSGEDAVQAILAGASAILVSNHGGRQLDSAISTIDALPGVVDAVHKKFPHIEIYMDGGVRSGSDVYKAIARGARMVFVGRPAIWGLALEGSDGVRKMMDILKTSFNETMLLAGSTSPHLIKRDTLLPPVPTFL